MVAKTKGGEVLPLMMSLLTPAALMAVALAVWRLGADMQWAEEFPIASGPFAHWQVWMAIAAIAYIAVFRLRENEKRPDR